MATAYYRAIGMTEQRRFFVVMSIMIFATAVAGFGSDIVAGIIFDRVVIRRVHRAYR